MCRMLLEVKALQKHYKARNQKRVVAVQSVSFELSAGQILAFLGPNGAGKTTSIKMIAGLVQPDVGDAIIDGHSVTNHPRLALQHIGAVLEGSRNLYWRLTPLENFAYWGGLRGISGSEARSRGLALLQEFGLEDKAKHTIQQLSRGMQQQVAICTALIHRPKLLLLDEPTLGLDLAASDRIQALIVRLARADDIGVLLTTHQMEVAQALSDRLSIIQKGRLILEGNTAEVLQQFSGNSYVFELAESMSEATRAFLTDRGAEFEDSRKFRMVCEGAAHVYEILESLKPLAIVRMERDTADLATVFRHYTNEGSGLAAPSEQMNVPMPRPHSARGQEADG